MTDLDRIVWALERAGQVVSAPDRSPPLHGVTDDSRRVVTGGLFCAIPGSADDGHRFVADAVQRGATAAIVMHPQDVPIPQVQVKDSRTAAALIAGEWYGHPERAMDLVGVTGTNGKSTTVVLSRHLLNEGNTAGSIGTLGTVDGAEQPLPNAPTLTTPGVFDLYDTLSRLAREGVRTTIVEVSSHALDQRRIEGLQLRAGVYTNLSHDHLDYHGDMGAYREAKMRLSGAVRDGGMEIVNADDSAWDELPEDPRLRRVRYGTVGGCHVHARGIELGAESTTMVLTFGSAQLRATTPLIGAFNVSNVLAGCALAWALKRDPETIVACLAEAPQVPGRLEKIAADGWVILRDYSHTPDALDRAIKTLRAITPGRLVVLFGCGGDRDRAKRPVMGRIAADGADLAIATSDNPRTEDPDCIIDEIEEGMAGTDHLRITDRREAIERAIPLLDPGDCLLLAGKGHETYQVVGTEKRPFDEREVVRELVAERERT